MDQNDTHDADIDFLLSSLPPLEDLSADINPPTLGEVHSMVLLAVDRRIKACNELKGHLDAASKPPSKDWEREWARRVGIDRDAEKYLSACLKLRKTVLKLSPR